MSDSILSDEKSETAESTENKLPQAEDAAAGKPADADVSTDNADAADNAAETSSETPAEAAAEGESAPEAAEKPADGEGASEDGAAQTQPEKKEEPAPVPTAPRCENPVAGRKVFFVNPPLYVENYLHLELKQHEYEVYIISDYKYTKAALRHFPDALCFIFIDDEMSYDEWFNFIQSFQKDEKLKTIFVGLMSAVITKQQHERFLMNLSLPGGFIMLTEFKGSALIEKIVGILDLNGAKGRRKYLRWDCSSSDTPINGYFANGSQLLQVSIVNISSVGFVCYYPASYGEVLKKNTLVASFSITLGRRSIVTPSVVFETKRADASRFISIMLFSKHVGQDDRKVIKNFVFDQLQDRFEKLVFAAQPDVEDYSNKAQKVAIAEETAKDSEKTENAENIEEAEEVLEVDEAEGSDSAEITADASDTPADVAKSDEADTNVKTEEHKENEQKVSESKTE